jgi:hypothetical protein
VWSAYRARFSGAVDIVLLSNEGRQALQTMGRV